MSNDYVSIDVESGTVRQSLATPMPTVNNSPSYGSPDLESSNYDSTTTPFIETEDVPPRAPLAESEYEDDPIDDSVPYTPEARPGVDDSFFPPETPSSNGGGSVSNDENQPLLPNAFDIVPRFGSEHDSDDNVDGNVPHTPNGLPGVDDSFFPHDTPIPNGGETLPTDDDEHFNPNCFDIGPRFGDDSDETDLPPRRYPAFPKMPDNTFRPDIIRVNGVDQMVPDVNVYQQKKTLALGMVDLALLSANANQLRYVLESFNRHPYFYFSITFISISIILQVAVGVGLILNSRHDVKSKEEFCHADRINNFVVIGIFLITIINVFVASFGVADSPTVRPTS